jgi:adenosylcobinamide-phosphate synthase
VIRTNRHGRHPAASARALGLVIGLAADLALADRPRGQPVGLFGAGATRLERLRWRDSRWAGVLFGAAGLVVAARAWLVAVGRPRRSA